VSLILSPRYGKANVMVRGHPGVAALS
jgi:hypothetical protein